MINQIEGNKKERNNMVDFEKKLDVMKPVEIYTDGSWRPDTEEVSGYGFVVVRNGVEIGHGYGQASAESRQILGELSAVMRACIYAINNGYKDITIIYDYEGVEKWINGSWKCKKDTTKGYKQFMEDKVFPNLNVTFQWTKSHNNNKWNDRADELANLGRVTPDDVVK